MIAEESDSDSDEDLEGGVRHDLMMADEKVSSEHTFRSQNAFSKNYYIFQ